MLSWPITSHSSLTEAIYRYDAIGRLQEAQRNSEIGSDSSISQFIRLGPLGTALLPTEFPQVLLIDEIDKSNIDLPGDLLNIFETGEYEIPELSRLARRRHEEIRVSDVSVLTYFGDQEVTIHDGKVLCKAFPFVVITSNGERELPPPFLRRCIRLDMAEPDAMMLKSIVIAHFPKASEGEKLERCKELIKQFLACRQKGDLATDQLFNTIHLTLQKIFPGLARPIGGIVEGCSVEIPEPSGTGLSARSGPIAQLVRLLRKVGYDPDLTELADLLWLAGYWTRHLPRLLCLRHLTGQPLCRVSRGILGQWLLNRTNSSKSSFPPNHTPLRGKPVCIPSNAAV